MVIQINRADCGSIYADRSGVADKTGKQQGLYVYFSTEEQIGLEIKLEFEFEEDALNMARQIFKRLGVTA